MKKLLNLLLFLPCLADGQVELLDKGQPVPFRAVMGDFKNDTTAIVFYDAQDNMVHRGFMVEKSFTCLNSTDPKLTGLGDRYIIARAFLNEKGDAMRPPFAYCEKRPQLKASIGSPLEPLKISW